MSYQAQKQNGKDNKLLLIFNVKIQSKRCLQILAESHAEMKILRK